VFLNVLAIVTPVFALIGIGFVAMKLKWLPDGGHQVLTQFGFKIAIPAMLFKAMLITGPLAGSPIRLLIAYLIPLAIIWVLTSLVAFAVLKRPAEDHPGLSMAATFGNTVMLGIPIALMAFGDGAYTPLAVLISVEAVLLWVVATLHIEFVRRGSAISLGALGGVFKDLAGNTIIMAFVLGIAGRSVGFTMPEPIDKVVSLLGQAGVPVALFVLGMTLANFKIAGETKPLGILTVLKLAALPVLVFVSAHYVFQLPALWTAVLTLHAAMPVGANPFLFATRYERGAAIVSAAIAFSTLIAVLSVTAVIVALKAVLGV
jgi:malonate transporter and related proteins